MARGWRPTFDCHGVHPLQWGVVQLKQSRSVQASVVDGLPWRTDHEEMHISKAQMVDTARSGADARVSKNDKGVLAHECEGTVDDWSG